MWVDRCRSKSTGLTDNSKLRTVDISSNGSPLTKRKHYLSAPAVTRLYGVQEKTRTVAVASLSHRGGALRSVGVEQTDCRVEWYSSSTTAPVLDYSSTAAVDCCCRAEWKSNVSRGLRVQILLLLRTSICVQARAGSVLHSSAAGSRRGVDRRIVTYGDSFAARYTASQLDSARGDQ